MSRRGLVRSGTDWTGPRGAGILASVSIGQTLAEARLAAGLTITEVSAQTRIRGALIRSIEADDFGPCGGDFYARGHIRAIARVVGADSRPLIAQYDAARQEEQAEEDPLSPLEDLFEPPPARDEPVGHEPPRPEPAWPPAPRARPAREQAAAAAAWLSWLPRPVVLIATLALAVIIGGAYQLAVGFGPPRPPAAGPGVSRPASSAAAPPAKTAPPPSSPPPAVAVRQVTPSGATATGPGGDGDNPDLAKQALSGDSSSPWHTHWYTSAAFGNLKSGTGLTLVLPRTVTVTGITVKFGDSGGAMQVKAGTSPGSLRTVASSGSAGGTTKLSFARTPARYIELWFTRLGTDNGAYQISVYDVSVSAVSSA